MNTPTMSPTEEPVSLDSETQKLLAALERDRRRVQDDQDAIRTQEQNLREYEARLRALQEEIDRLRPRQSAGGSASGLGGHGMSGSSSDPVLPAGWEKLHRARELLEAEQAHLRDDRMAVHDREAAVKSREEVVTLREKQLAEREAVLAAGAKPSAARADQMSSLAKLTRTPFHLARLVLRG
ncbi:MAG: hypothetical protein Q7S40_27310 [Opitutaceae bacterium]|nr:hypothetical protein [Opitutaceae bacterium]